MAKLSGRLLLIAIFAAFMVVIHNAEANQPDENKAYDPTLSRCSYCLEAEVPGFPTWFYNLDCGFKPNTQITFRDTVKYTWPYWITDWPFIDPAVGTVEDIYFPGPVTDANGCMAPFSYMPWGIGGHRIIAYQILRGNHLKELTRLYFNTSPHHYYGEGCAKLYYSPPSFYIPPYDETEWSCSTA